MYTKAIASLTVALAMATMTPPASAAVHDDQPKAAKATSTFWTDLSFKQAKEKSVEEGRIFLAYATASWCPPCQHMERTTWIDPKVAEWFNEHGIAYKFDVDEDRQLAKSLGVRAMPTLFAFREGELFDRVTGARSAEQLIGWLENVKAGRSEMDALRERAGNRMDAEGKVDIRDRMNIARMLVEAGDFDDATDEYLWLWDNMLDHQPSMVGVRSSFMISDMTRLAQRHPPAMEAFRQRRAAYLPAIESGEADRDELLDWITLAQVVNEGDSVLQWFDAAKEDAKMRRLLPFAGHELRTRLVAEQRWADLALLYPDPVAYASRHLETMRVADREVDERFKEEMRRTLYRSTRTSVSYIYAAMLAVGDEEAAADVAGLLLDADDTAEARQILVSTALRANELRQIHLKWLDEALAMGAHVRQLRREVAEALANSHT